jgi:ribosomal protein L7/L12
MPKSFSVFLSDLGSNRPALATYFRGVGLSLAETSDLFAKVPSSIVACEEEEARRWAAELSALGAVVEVRPTAPWDFRGAGAVSRGADRYDVVLQSSGPSTLETVKVVRDVAACSVSNAALVVERTPSFLLRSVSRDEATRAQRRLVAVGAEVELWSDESAAALSDPGG